MAVIFSKIKAKNAVIAVATASIFNAEIWKKNNISLSYLSGQSTIISFVTFLYQERKVKPNINRMFHTFNDKERPSHEKRLQKSKNSYLMRLVIAITIFCPVIL